MGKIPHPTGPRRHQPVPDRLERLAAAQLHHHDVDVVVARIELALLLWPDIEAGHLVDRVVPDQAAAVGLVEAEERVVGVARRRPPRPEHAEELRALAALEIVDVPLPPGVQVGPALGDLGLDRHVRGGRRLQQRQGVHHASQERGLEGRPQVGVPDDGARRLVADGDALVSRAFVVVEDRRPDRPVPFPELVLRPHPDEGLLLAAEAEQVLRLVGDLQVGAGVGDRGLRLPHEGDLARVADPEVLAARQRLAVEAHVDGFGVDPGQPALGQVDALLSGAVDDLNHVLARLDLVAVLLTRVDLLDRVL